MRVCALWLGIPGIQRKRLNHRQEACALVVSMTESSRRKNISGLSTRPRPLQKCSLYECFQQCYSAVTVKLSSGVLGFLELP